MMKVLFYLACVSFCFGCTSPKEQSQELGIGKEKQDLVKTCIYRDSIGKTVVERTIVGENQTTRTLGFVACPSVTLYCIDRKEVTKEKFMEVFEEYAVGNIPNRSIQYVGQDTVVMHLDFVTKK